MRGNNRHTEERKLQKDFEGQEGMRDIKRMKQRERERERDGHQTGHRTVGQW